MKDRPEISRSQAKSRIRTITRFLRKEDLDNDKRKELEAALEKLKPFASNPPEQPKKAPKTPREHKQKAIRKGTWRKVRFRDKLSCEGRMRRTRERLCHVLKRIAKLTGEPIPEEQLAILTIYDRIKKDTKSIGDQPPQKSRSSSPASTRSSSSSKSSSRSASITSPPLNLRAINIRANKSNEENKKTIPLTLDQLKEKESRLRSILNELHNDMIYITDYPSGVPYLSLYGKNLDARAKAQQAKMKNSLLKKAATRRDMLALQGKLPVVNNTVDDSLFTVDDDI